MSKFYLVVIQKYSSKRPDVAKIGVIRAKGNTAVAIWTIIELEEDILMLRIVTKLHQF